MNEVNPISVMIVEDEAAHAEAIRRSFEAQGDRFQITTVANLKTARARLAQAAPDLVIADWRLPDGHGIDLLPTTGGKPTLPMVLMTSYGNEEVAVSAIKAGALDYVVKSEATLNDLPHVVDRALRAWNQITERQRAEQHITLLSFALNNVREAAFLIDEKARFHYINEEACRVLGYTRDELMGMSVPDVDPDFTMESWCQHWQKLRTQRLVCLERRNRTKNGRIYPIEVDSNYFEFEGKAYDLALVRDITERKASELALRQSEQRKTILNQIASIFLTAPDEQMYAQVLGVVLQSMKSRFGIFGFINRDGDLVMPSLTGEVWSQCRVSDKSIVFPKATWGDNLWARALRECRTFCSDGPFRTPEGHIRIDHFLTVPIVFGSTAIGLLSVANANQSYTRDDTELLETIAASISPILNARMQRDAQEQGKQQAEKERDLLSKAIEQAAEITFITDTQGTIQYANPAFEQITGYPPAEVIGQNPRLLKSGKHDDAFYHTMWDTLTRGETWRGHLINKKKNGTLYEEEAMISPIRDAAGTITNYVAVKRDVTHEVQLEAQFRQAQKMEAVGRLAGGVAHDFNNLLMAIIGYSNLMLKNLAPHDPLHEYAEGIWQAGERAAGVTRQLLALSRQQVLQSRVLNLNDVVSNIHKILSRLISENIRLELDLESNLGSVKADPSQIEQVILNLVVNARDAMSGGGELVIHTANVEWDATYVGAHHEVKPGSYVMLAVTDTGCGMTEKVKQHIFEPFFTTKEEGKGTGLGLATVYGIVKQSDGFINVYSEVGHGTSFKVYLPRFDEPVHPHSTDEEEDTVPTGTETILLVEDEDIVRRPASACLREFGYTVLEARHGHEAIEIAQHHAGPIDLLMTDMVMPGMNGREMAQRLETIRPGLRTIYMSGYLDAASIPRGALQEGMPFLQKPFTPDTLARGVRKVLDGR